MTTKTKPIESGSKDRESTRKLPVECIAEL